MTVATLIDAMALMQELCAVEGLPPAQAAALADELQADLAAYAREWDAWAAEQAREARADARITCWRCGFAHGTQLRTCPTCAAVVVPF